MGKRLLVIDRDDQGHFFLSVEKGILTLGGNAADAEAILRDLHISRIHCEVEVEEDQVFICGAAAASSQETDGASLPRQLHPGERLRVGRSHLHLEEVAAPAEPTGAGAPETSVLPDFTDELMVEQAKQPTKASAPAADSPAAAAQEFLVKRLTVIEGADRGRSFNLPEAGTITIGKSKKAAEIVLHDLYVSRVHCQLEIAEDHILVTHMHGDNGTLINGQRITQQGLQLGDVLRVGNEHLKLEIVSAEDNSSGADEDDEETVAVAAESDAEDYEVEVLDADSQSEAAESDDGATAANADPYSVPHAPVDKLLKLEGQVFGHYQIGPLLGRGQSSIVFRALDAKNQQLVALKVISPDFPADDAELQRFVRALKGVPALQNPYLVILCGAGKTGPYCWIAREHVEGESVARMLQRLGTGNRPDWTRACRVALHLGKALDFLHQHRVTHGNITPRNVLIRKSDRATKLTDLMLSRALDGSRLQKAILGKKLLAELPYLAPEQTDPHAPGTTLGDLYALGTVLYTMLTGQPPFSGSSPREIVAQIQEGKVVKPSKLQRGIPAPFEASVLMLMARRPEDRFQTAAEMLSAVQPIAEENEIEV
ncbi:MAG: protein kinase domain-containing protein [Gemmataceae bacterium]